ncbi:MAG: alpha/beta hydrolase [Opitutae bacterium]|nr:alpha/beta hydrolase [Opitutae bacterium]
MKWLLLILGTVSALAALLNFVRAPDSTFLWKVAVAVTEYGHLLVILPLGLAALAWISTEGPGRAALLVLCGVAAAGLLRPALTAWRMAADLPRQLTVAMGTSAGTPAPFAFDRLYVHALPAVPRKTETYARADGRDLTLDFYRSARIALAPCIVVVHGGGWDSGDSTQLSEWNSRWAARGYAVAAVNYRLAPRSIWPAQRDDLQAALAWLKQNAGRLGIDPHRLVLLGRSAGGQIAAAVGYGARDPDIVGIVSFYAPQDMPFAWSVSREDDALNSVALMRRYFGGAPDTPERRALYDSASAQFMVDGRTPPTLLLHGRPDTLVWYRHSRRLAARLQEAGVRHYLLELPWATHGFDYNPDGPGGQLADYAIARFLAAVAPVPH